MNSARLKKLWDTLHSSYWFLPSLMAVCASLLAFAMLMVDNTRQDAITELGWIYSGGPNGARALLSAVASSMITVAATAFSITIVALQLASSNFGPRLLRNFMQDTGNQIVLGSFIATFIYCLLILRTIHGEDFDLFVPQLSVTVGIILTILSVGVLIYFIHHASTIIQASHVISGVSHELEQAIDRLFPSKLGKTLSEHHQPVEEIPVDFKKKACSIPAPETGYLQAIDGDQLIKIACRYNLLLQIQARPGQFVIEGSDLVKGYPAEQIYPQLNSRISEAFVFGNERTEQQDIEFPINQLVEVGLRAISPAVNDPFTTIRCIDRLSAGLSHLAEREFPSPYRYDQTHHLRIIVEPVTFEQLVDSAFSQIRRYARSDVAVTVRLLEAIAQIAHHASRPQDRFVLEQQAKIILQGSCEELSQKQDQEEVKQKYDQVMTALKKNYSNSKQI